MTELNRDDERLRNYGDRRTNPDGRALLRWRQFDLAEAAGLHPKAVAYWEAKTTLSDLGIVPAAAEGVIESYLYAYRPQGQYTQLTENGGEA